jgi:hypothetical protein
MEFYVVDSVNKSIRHKVLYEDVIMCHLHRGGCVIVMAKRPDIPMKNTIDSIYDFYFKRNKSFIRASSNYIVNTHHIISAEERKFSNEILLTLTNNNKAVLRRSHDYAYFILNGEHRPKKNQIEDSDAKDAIIMSDIKNVHDVVEAIKKTTGEIVNSRYVVKRYKQLKIQL